MKNILLIFVSLIAGSLCTFASNPKSEKPNVIVIMTDDQGYPELSIHGNPILKTPIFRQVCSEQCSFWRFPASPMYAPTRGQLITGMDAVTNGLVNVSSGRAF